MKRKRQNIYLMVQSIFFILLIGSALSLTAADVITNGTFDSDISGWLHSDNGNGSVSFDNVIYGAASGSMKNQSTAGRNTIYTWADSQYISTSIGSNDNVFLSLYWYKYALGADAGSFDITVDIIKPDLSTATLWSETGVPTAGSFLDGNVTALDVSASFDQTGNYYFRITGNAKNGRATNAYCQFNIDDIILDIQTAANQPPVVTDIPDQTIAEGASFTTITLDNYVSDPDNTDADMTWTYSGNTELIVDITSRIATITTPNADWNGAETITFRATDPGALWDEDPAVFTVTAQNDPPVVTDIPDQTIPEGLTFTTITLDNYASDVDNTDAEMTWTYSGNTELIVDITNRVATITTPNADWNGAETITFRATDPGLLWDEDPALFTVTAQNDPPVVTDIPDQTVPEGSTFTTITLDNYVSDVDNTDAEMTWTYSGNTELTVDITSRIATITIPNTDWNGVETITFRATDPGSLWDEDPAIFTVTAQNDPPVVTGIPDQTISEGNSFTTITLDNYVSDVDNTDAEMTWTYSGNTELIVDITNRVATITTPSPTWTGAETIAFRATDPGSLWDEDPAIFTVIATSSAPVVTDIPDQTIPEGSSFTTITLDDYVSDPDNTDAEMTWTYSGNTELIVDITSRIATITTPNVDWNGAETITFRATDPGLLWDEDPALFTVTAQNDPPVVTADATTVSPLSVNRFGANTTTISTDFADIDVPGVGTFTATFKVKDASETEYILVNNLSNGSGGLIITDGGGGNYTASYTWDPGPTQPLGVYDLYFEVTDGTNNAIDGYTANADELTITETIINNPPSITSTYVNKINVDRLGSDNTTIICNFTDSDLHSLSNYVITFKIREPNNSNEIILVDGLTNGNGGLTVIDNGGGSYTAQYVYNPDDAQTLGYYDLYCSVSDGYDNAIDDFVYNLDELQIIENIVNAAPTITAGVTAVSPGSINRVGSETTTFSATFDDSDNPGNTAFYITFKAYGPYGGTVYTISDALAHGQSGMTITDNGGGNYTASIDWDPPDNAVIGYYDIYCLVDDGIEFVEDLSLNNLDELLIGNAGENLPPIVPADNVFASPNGLERIGAHSTTISANFTDNDAAGVNDFKVTIKVREPDNSTEIVLADLATDGAGVTMTDLGGGIFNAALLWDPGDAQTLGYYDLYFMVTDNVDTAVDDYYNNLDELEIYDAITNNAPSLVAGNTTAIPNSVNRIGSEFTTIKSNFSDPDAPGIGAYTITIKVRDESLTEYTLVNAATHGNQGLRVRHLGGTDYEASVLWDPDVSQAVNTYDLYFYVEDQDGVSAVDNYISADVLSVTSSAIAGDGNLLRRTNEHASCGGATSGCHNYPGHNGYGCLDCHTPHSTRNIMLIRENILVDTVVRSVDFRTRGIGDPDNPDPVAGTWSGAMADSTDNVFTGICEICHDDRVGHHRFDGSQPPPNHNDATWCSETCHPHADGFTPSGGGEPTGGDGCGCHSSFATIMGTGALPYHHQISSENADYNVASKTCLMCHVHHDIFSPDQNPTVGARAKNLRADITSSVVQGDGTVLLNSDYQSTGTGGICLSCHTSTQAKTFTRPDGTTETMAISKSDFDASDAHNYNATSTFSDASTFNGNCVKCHNDNTAKTHQSSTNKFAVHNSDYDAILNPFATASPTDPLEEDVCFGCHSGTSGQDVYSAASMSSTSQNIQDAFSRTYTHPTATYSGRHSAGETSADLGDGNRHAECNDCHDPHAAAKGTHDGSSNLVSNALKGTWGVDITNWSNHTPPTPTNNANLFDTFTSGDYTEHNPATKEYQICLKCHSNYVTLPAGSPNIAEEINPAYPSSHAIVQAGDNPFCNSTTMNEPWATSKINYCSDCHRSDTSTDPEGPHGSNADHLLVATIVSNNVNGTPLCDVCHLPSVYWTGSGTPSDYDDHPATQGQHKKAPGCFSCHMWDHSSTAGLGLSTNDWPGTFDNTASLPPPTRIWIHGQNRKWVYNEQDGTAGTGQPVENFVNGYIANMDHGANRCWTETCKVHSNKAY